MTNGIERVEEIRAATSPVAGEPGVRVDEQGRRYYSAAWLDECLAADELAARRVERHASLSAQEPPAWEPTDDQLWTHETLEPSPPAWGDEAGNVDARLVATLAAVAAAAVVVVLVWKFLVAGGVLYAAYRHLTRHSRRRRPRSSWSSLATSSAALFAAWNSRWLKPPTVTRNGRPLRVSVPARTGRDHVDEYGEIPF